MYTEKDFYGSIFDSIGATAGIILIVSQWSYTFYVPFMSGVVAATGALALSSVLSHKPVICRVVGIIVLIVQFVGFIFGLIP